MKCNDEIYTSTTLNCVITADVEINNGVKNSTPQIERRILKTCISCFDQGNTFIKLLYNYKGSKTCRTWFLNHKKLLEICYGKKPDINWKNKN